MPTTPKIHVLGLGNLGRLFAHSLANKSNPPPITLLFHRPSLLKEWQDADQKIHIITNGLPNSNGSFQVEDLTQHGHDQTEAIENLIVTTKTIHTVKALNAVKDRLGRDSTVLFAQNGMGTVEEVTRTLFPDESERPNFLAAITSHGVFSQGPFRSVHAGLANITIGHVNPRAGEEELKSRYLLEQIVDSPILAATEAASSELLKLQLEKLVINAMINPLTVLWDCKNGELFGRREVLDLMRSMLREASQVLQSLPENARDQDRFSVGKLEERVLSVAENTAGNVSSMLQDVRAGRETEIEYINGWIVRKGWENAVDCVQNEKMVGMVKEKQGTRKGVEGSG